MSRFLELNVVEFSRDHFGDATRYGDDEAHLLLMKAAKTHYLNVGTIDMVTPVKRTIKDDNDEDVEIDSTYFHIQFEGTTSETQAHTDRDSWILVDGLASDWVAKVEAVLAGPEPEGQRVIDRGTWESGQTFAVWDTVKHPENSTKLLCIKAHDSKSKTELADKALWCALGEI